MTRQMHVSLFLMLLLFLFVQLCSTSGILAADSAEVVQNLPQQGQGASWGYTVVTTNRTFIRINTSTLDLVEGNHCSKVNQPSIKDFKGDDAPCLDQFVLSEEMKKTFLDTILPAAIKLHADRLLVDPVEGPLKVPEFEDDNVCKKFIVPQDHHSKGVENADMVLYVAARPELAFGVPCAYDNNSGRPVAGAINVQIFPLKIQRYNVRRVAHEIAHVLGFDYTVFEKNNMVAEIQFGNGMRRVVNSNQTMKMAQKYYNCSELEGLELAYATVEAHILNLSHLAWRNAVDDLMSSRYNFGAMHYSALTMSVFDGLPFYTVNWGMEESMSWGNQSGCDLFKSECKAEDATTISTKICPKDKNVFSCTSDRLGYGVCTPLPDDRYPDKKKCNVAELVEPPRGDKTSLLCSEKPQLNISGSIFERVDSFCLDTEEYNAGSMPGVFDDETIPLFATGICARVSCEEGKVRVMYNGISDWKNCSGEGDIIEVKPAGLNNTIKIKCPKYSEVCTIFSDGSSLLPLIEPKPLPAPVITTTTTTTENNESHQEQGETVGTESGHTNNNSSSVPSQSVQRTQNTTGDKVSANDNVTVPVTTGGNINKNNLTSPQVKEELKIHMGMDGTPAAACVLHALFLLMAAAAAAAALAVPL
ncbi:surface protease GP63 [Trypanosoma theileri]|uniref:Leishmanolysin-like peptidase n=1 Tax=Trypanosoma theileri TaxID=67003 RepID=A0A1X0NDM7_9TRYP|nr:surface protease GP63 [Trypanosoma theileri]ORC81347.1 surface protease GP63 [Trypanosoma theileri]